MNAIELLKSQHREVEELFKLIENCADGHDKSELVRELADALAAHATIEEQIFYPSVMVDSTEDMLREAVEEHLSVKRLLVDIMRSSARDKGYDAKITVLKEQIEHHVKEEENDLFPKVRKEMGDQLEDLGAQMEALFALLQQGAPRNQVPKETAEPAPLE